MLSSSSSNCGATKRKARSGIAPLSGARAASRASWVAASPDLRVDSPAPTRIAFGRVRILVMALSSQTLGDKARPYDAHLTLTSSFRVLSLLTIGLMVACNAPAASPPAASVAASPAPVRYGHVRSPTTPILG